MSLAELPLIDVVMGVDLATYRTGLAAIEIGRNAKLVAHQRIVAPGETDFDNYLERWDLLIDQTQNFMEQVLKGRPMAVAIEQPNSFRNGKTTRLLCGAFGVLLYWLNNNGMVGMEINTAHAKKVFCGKSGGKKPTVARANELYGLNLKYSSNPEKSEDDVADAIQVAYTARYHLTAEDDWFKERSLRD